jgi:hypothetical protein
MPATIDTYIAALGAPVAAIAADLRELLDARLGADIGTIWHGHPVWKDDRQPVAGFKAYSSYVTFMIWNGRAVDDPSGRLAMSGSGMGSVKLREPADVDVATFGGWLRQAVGK